MEDYAIFVVEGRTTKELRQNLEPALSNILEYDATFEINGNNVAFERKTANGVVSETDHASVYDIGGFFMLILPIKLKTAVNILKENGNILKDKIIASIPFKSLVFTANKESLMGVINALAYSTVQDYKKRFEEKNIKFNPDLLPIYIYGVEKDYKVPVAIYEQFHIMYDKVFKVIKELQ